MGAGRAQRNFAPASASAPSPPPRLYFAIISTMLLFRDGRACYRRRRRRGRGREGADDAALAIAH